MKPSKEIEVQSVAVGKSERDPSTRRIESCADLVYENTRSIAALQRQSQFATNYMKVQTGNRVARLFWVSNRVVIGNRSGVSDVDMCNLDGRRVRQSVGDSRWHKLLSFSLVQRGAKCILDVFRIDILCHDDRF